jgi:SsrA-binding protein
MKIITQVKKKLHDYRIIEKFTAGIVLTGSEIKSLRNYHSSINEAYISPQERELYIVNMHITVYKHSQNQNYSENYNSKKKKLLLHRSEIKNLIFQLKTKNYSLVPLMLFINDKGWAKLEIALVQHLRKYQIKDKVKEKEIKRQLQKKEFW